MEAVIIGILGYLGFAVYKWLGYSLAGKYLNRVYASSKYSLWHVGLVRVIIGMVIGGLYTGIWAYLDSIGYFKGLPYSGGRLSSALPFLVILVPVRLGEWALTLWIFYDREFRQIGKGCLLTLLGTAWSFVLDIPVIIGLITIVASIC
jgi:hypothetical protein